MMHSKRTAAITALAAVVILAAAGVARAHGTAGSSRFKKMHGAHGMAGSGRFGKMHGMRTRIARASHRGGRRSASPPLISIALRLQDELKLTEEQVSKLSDLRDGYRRRWIRARADLQIANLDLRKSLREDAVNLEGVEKNIRDIEKMRADLRLERIRTIEAGKTLLSEDQRKQLQSLVRSGSRRGAGPHFGGMMTPGEGTKAPEGGAAK